MENRLNRAEVPAELTWDLSDLYNSDAEWHAALNALENDIQKLDSFKGHLHTSSPHFIKLPTFRRRAFNDVNKTILICKFKRIY